MTSDWMGNNNKPFLKLNSEETSRGFKELENFGIKTSDKWICIHNRDSAFLKKNTTNMGHKTDKYDWSYHDYRNFSIHSMMPAANFLADKGYFILRMGSVVNEKINTDNPKIIDYANSKHRSDFMDIFLLSNCVTYIAGDSGLCALPIINRKLPYYVNYSLTLLNHLSNTTNKMFLFKRLKNLENGKMLTLKEILKSNFAYTTNGHDFKKFNIMPIDNSKDDIKLFATEIEKDLNNNYDNKEDLKAQNEFWNIYKNFSKKKDDINFCPKISQSFLKKNIDILN